MRWFLILLLSAISALSQSTSYTEFYCNLNGTNVNGGGTTNAAATYTSSNGNWDGTSVFTPTDGSTPASSVNVGDFASICLDAATVSVFISRVVTVAAGVNGAITVSTTAISGSAPAAGATGRTLRVGGAWRGAFAAVGFPFGFVANTLTNATGNMVRVNINSGYSNSISAGLTHGINGPIVFSGYTTTAGDGGKFIIDGGNNNGFVPLALGAPGIFLIDCIVQNAGGNFTAGIEIQNGGNMCLRCVSRGMKQSGSSGFSCEAASTTLIECEAYSNSGYGFGLSSASLLIRCLAHDNADSGISASGGPIYISRCISVSNVSSGFRFTGTGATTPFVLQNCDAVSNKVNGFEIVGLSVSPIYVENCNFIGNSGYAINCWTNALHIGSFTSNYFGSGTMTNALGEFNPSTGATNGLLIAGTSKYPTDVNPYSSMSSHNFSLLPTAASYGKGRGSFTDLKYSGGTVAYPSVGAAVATNAATAGGGSWTFSQ